MSENVDLEKVYTPVDGALERGNYGSRGPSYGYGYGYGSAEDEEMHVRDMWRIVRKRKWLVISVTVIITTIVAVEMLRAPSVYQASTLIEVEKGTTTATKTGDLIVQDNDLDSLKTKILAIKSQPVLQDVVKTLRLDRDSAFISQTNTRPLLPALKALLGIASGQPPDSSDDSPDGSANSQTDSSTPDEKTLEAYAQTLDGSLQVDLVPETRAIRISFSHSNRKEAAAIANQVAKSFMDTSFKSQTSQVTHTSEWLDTSTRELKSRVEKAEQDLADYTKTHNIFSSDGKQSLTTDKLSQLHDQLTRAQTDLILKQTLYQEIKAGHIDQIPDVYLDSQLAALRSKIGELQTQQAQLSVKYGPQNPNLLEVTQELAALQKQLSAGTQALASKLQGDYQSATANVKGLQAALDAAKSDAVEENQNDIQLSILKSDVETAKALYADFLQKTNQANLQVAEQSPNMHVIQPALVPTSPVAPKRKTNVLIAFFISLGAGIGLTFFLEYLDNTIKSVEDVARYVQLPALGVIPAISEGGPIRRQLKGKSRSSKSNSNGNRHSSGQHASLFPSAGIAPQVQKAQIVSPDSRSSAAEAYRALRTSVLLSTAGSPPKTLLVTSAQPGEGKTTTAINTAVSLAQLGSEVLIIDADMRKPNVHKVFACDGSRGLSTYLSRDVDIDSLIQKQQFPHLSVLPSGPIPPNPAELISSDRMRDMLKTLSERYDHILIDSPPLINVTDPVILSTIVEGVVLVICWGKSTRDTARRVRAELTSVGAKIFGVVLNNVDFRREGYDEYYYYRYYTDYGKDASSEL